MRAYRMSLSVATLILACGLAAVACSGSDSEDNPGGKAGTGGDAGAAGTGGGSAGVAGTGGGVGGEAGTGGSTGGTGGTGGTGATGGTGGTGGTAGAAGMGGAGGEGGFVCDGTGFTSESGYGEMTSITGGYYWYLQGGTETEFVVTQFIESYGAPSAPGTYTLSADDANYDTCGACFFMGTGCSSSGCQHIMMANAGGTYTITDLGSGAGDTFEVTLDDVSFREVLIDSNAGTASDVPDGATWCIENSTITGDIYGPHVDMDQPTGMTCDYPAPPYDFLGPEDGETSPAARTVPPMAWPGAYFNGQETGLDLAQFRCDHPEIKTLVIVTGGGWCPACKQFMEETVCPTGGLEDQLHEAGAELLYVWGDNNTPGSPATNQFADQKVTSYGCKGGYRIADVDNTAGARVVFMTPMSLAIPWAAIVRLEDMKLTHEQGEESQYWMDFIGIAEANQH